MATKAATKAAEPKTKVKKAPIQEVEELSAQEMEVMQEENIDAEIENDLIEDNANETAVSAPEGNKKAKASDKSQELSVDELVAKKVSRFTREVEQANKREKKDLYRSEHVITEYGDEDIETEETLLRRDYLELVGSTKSGKILQGKLIGFRYAGEARKSTCLAEIEYGCGLCTVLIPSYVFYDYDVSQYIEANKSQVIENNIVRRINSTVKFVVRHVDEKTMTAYGDRLQAQAIIGYDNWLKPLRDGKPRIVNGLIVKGQVVLTTSRSVIVDALGCEIRVMKDEVSHAYVGDAREELSVGDNVNVRILSVNEKTVEKNDRNYRLVDATGSIRMATPNHKKRMYDQFRIDGKYAATVTYVEEAGVFCRLRGDVDVLCALPRYGKNPMRGDQRIVKITGKNDENLFIYGVFVNS